MMDRSDLLAKIHAAEEAAQDARRRGDFAAATEAAARAARLWQQRREELARQASTNWTRTIRWRGGNQ